MRTLLNIAWLFLSGLWLAVGYAIAGVLMLILIVTIPFGIQAFKLARYSLWPFGRTLVKRPDAGWERTPDLPVRTPRWRFRRRSQLERWPDSRRAQEQDWMPGALVPVEIDPERGRGDYREPACWGRHRLLKRSPD